MSTLPWLAPLNPELPHYGYRPQSLTTPAVSIITPYYNTGPLFMETVQSVLTQSLQQWEWIIVNDGSDEPIALQTLLPLRCADSRIRIVDQANQGLPAARNAGVAASFAPLLFFLDSDDLLTSTALEKLAWTLVSHPESAFATTWHITFGHHNYTWPRGFDTRHAFLHENMVVPLVMVRREIFDTVGGFAQLEPGLDGLEDYEFWLRCAAHGYWGHDIHEYLLWFRTKPPQAYTSYQWTFRNNSSALATFRQTMQRRYPELFQTGLPNVGRGGTLLDTYSVIPTELPFQNHLQTSDNQRRVLILMPWMHMGGSDRFVLDLAAGLIARGDKVSVCLLRNVEHTWMDELLRITNDVFNVGALVQPADYPRFLHYLIQSRQITTVLISNSLLAYRLLPYLRAHCPETTFVDYLHMEEEHWRSGGIPRAGIDHDELLDLHIVSSQHVRDWMIERGADATRINVCTINIDPDLWKPNTTIRHQVRHELGIAEDMPLILFAGRLVSQKRPRLVVETLRHLNLPFVCLIAGDGTDRRWLKQFIRQHNLEQHIRMLGAVPHTRVRNLLAASDILLLPSAQEGIALILFESLAMGVVPIAADVGGQRELVTPECGVLIPHSDTEQDSYVTALHDLISNPTKRQRMSQAGRARIIRDFRLDQMLDSMQQSFDQATTRACVTPQPGVGKGNGNAAAVLAIEHYQLETRLRGLAPVHTILAFRQSSLWTLHRKLRGLYTLVHTFDRKAYATRRIVIEQIRKIIRLK